MTTPLPVVMTSQGLTPLTPLQILQTLINDVLSTNPGATANLPGVLIEDITSTDVAAIQLCNQAMVELINSITPYGANIFLLTQLGNIYGQILGQSTNTSVYVLFTGTPGFVIGTGFTVSDGSYQYTVVHGGIVTSSGTILLYCIATVTGTWAVPDGTITQLITSVPSTVTLSCTNPNAGIPSIGAQSEESFRAQVLQAGIAPSTGALTYLKMQLQQVPGVVARLVAVQKSDDFYKIIVGGGDPYSVANAIFIALFDYGDFVGSEDITLSGVTKANPGVVDTFPIVHGLTTGQTGTFSGVVGMTELNTGTYTATVLSAYTFSIGVDTSGYTAWSSGGIFYPTAGSAFTQNVAINDYPDTYQILFVTPPLQQLGIAATWQTSQGNFTSDAAIAQLAVPALIAYVNSLPVGYVVNLLELQSVFLASIATILTAQYVSSLVFSFTLGGISVSPVGNILAGDPQGYFNTDTSSVTVVRA